MQGEISALVASLAGKENPKKHACHRSGCTHHEDDEGGLAKLSFPFFTETEQFKQGQNCEGTDGKVHNDRMKSTDEKRRICRLDGTFDLLELRWIHEQAKDENDAQQKDKDPGECVVLGF
jgi:hypothetical protein